MATPNYGYEKRQRELAKRKKKEEKLKAKSERKHDDPVSDGEQPEAPMVDGPGNAEDATGNIGAPGTA